jgi:hypothetical protein
MLYREARALGLDDDDPEIKRYLAHKLLLLAERLAIEDEPSPDELRAWWMVRHATTSPADDVAVQRAAWEAEQRQHARAWLLASLRARYVIDTSAVQ